MALILASSESAAARRDKWASSECVGGLPLFLRALALEVDSDDIRKGLIWDLSVSATAVRTGRLEVKS